ncbi:MAG: FAD binding domain-containing protein, partial [Candidatus Limnocylindrales bacterium]
MAVAEYLVPEDLPTAIELLGRHRAGLTVMAGGTVVMSQLNDGGLRPERILSLRRAGLNGLQVRPDERGGGRPDVLAIGAATTLSRLAGQDTVALLAEAALGTGSWSIRNMASVGGNLFTPPPGGDVAVALLALDTRLRLA